MVGRELERSIMTEGRGNATYFREARKQSVKQKKARDEDSALPTHNRVQWFRALAALEVATCTCVNG